MPKPPEAFAPLLGVWTACWHTWGSEMGFRADGTYYHLYPTGVLYTGTWRVSEGSLFVRERSDFGAGTFGDWKEWGAALGQDGTGWTGRANGDYGRDVDWAVKRAPK